MLFLLGWVFLSLQAIDVSAGGWPQCLQDVSTSSIQQNEQKLSPEVTAQRILQAAKVSDSEIFVRLVFSEGLASDCMQTAEAPGVLEGIAWVLRNRLTVPSGSSQGSFGKGVEVVFAPKQFRSTLGRYDVSRRKEFLCPSAAGAEWKTIWRLAEQAWQRTAFSSASSASALNPLPDTYNYYLAKHFESSALKSKVQRPEWAKPPHQRIEPAIATLTKNSSCIEFWKTNRRF